MSAIVTASKPCAANSSVAAARIAERRVRQKIGREKNVVSQTAVRVNDDPRLVLNRNWLARISPVRAAQRGYQCSISLLLCP